MKSLAIDTSTNYLSLALFDGLELVALQQLNIVRQHGEYLLPAVRQLLAQNNWQAQELSRLYIGRGPGSYTGIRIGVTMVKTWAKAFNIELYSLSSLALTASQLYFPFEIPALIIPLIDARRGTAYTGAYAWKKERDSFQLKTVLEDHHVHWETWVKEQLITLLKEKEIKQVFFIGQNIGSLVQSIEPILSAHDLKYAVEESAKIWPAVENVRRVENKWEKDIDIFVPYYAHQSLAEQEWENSQGLEAKEETNERYIEHFYETDPKSKK